MKDKTIYGLGLIAYGIIHFVYLPFLGELNIAHIYFIMSGFFFSIWGLWTLLFFEDLIEECSQTNTSSSESGR